MGMNICISGWYFHRPFLEAIQAAGYPALIVGHRTDRDSCGLPIVGTPEGRGLDFGCYQQYLINHWDEQSDVLFIQDDGEITGTALDDIAGLRDKAEIDHAFIFRDEYDEHSNGGHSSRAMWFRSSLLWQIRREGGFAVDWSNIGNTLGYQANWALGAFAQRIADNLRCGWIAIVPGLQMARRGWMATKTYQYKRTADDQKGIVTPESVL